MSLTSYALSRSRAVRASAGTGKTHTLVETYLALLTGTGGREPLRPSAILALTFTERAAAEMKERILSRLRAVGTPGPARDAWLLSGGSNARVRDSGELLRLEPLLLGAPIGTFHGFCGRLLREHAAECGIPLSPEILDEVQSAQMLSEAALEAVTTAMSGPKRADTLKLAEALPLRTGLMEALVGVHDRLGERGLTVKQLALHPGILDEEYAQTRAALPATLRRLRMTPGLTPAAVTKGRELAEIADRIERAEDDDALLFALNDAFLTVGGNWGGPSVAETRRAMRAAVSQVVAGWACKRSREAGTLLLDLLAATEDSYARRKAEAGALDFSDLLRGARDLLRRQPGVRRRVQERLGAVLVDEMQDTSPIQGELLALLLDPRDDPPTNIRDARPIEGRLLVVGDPKQSIYGFRGADATLFDDAVAALKDSGGEEAVLRESRRSTTTMVNLLNHLSAAALGARFAEHDRLVALKEGGLPRPGWWLRARVTPEMDAHERREQEARLLAQHIRLLLSGQGGLSELRPSDVAILLRTRTQAEIYRAALSGVGVPVRVGRGGSLLGRPEVQDAMALLTLLADPQDAHALAIVLRSPLVMLRDEALIALSVAHEKPALTVARVLQGELPELARQTFTVEETAALTRLKDALAPLRVCAANLDAGQALVHLWDALDGWAMLELHDDGGSRVANLRALEGLLRGRSVPDAVRFIREARHAGADFPLGTPEGTAEQVTILTMHEAKGLEYRVVALADLCAAPWRRPARVEWHHRLGLAIRTHDHITGVVKRSEARTPARDLHDALRSDGDLETARLLYVALTRAKELLLFSGEPKPGATPAPDTMAGRLFPSLTEAVSLGLVEVLDQPLSLPAASPVRVVPEDIPLEVERPWERTHIDATALADAMSCPRRFAHLHLTPALSEPVQPDEISAHGQAAVARRMATLVERAFSAVDLGALEGDAAQEIRHALRSVGADEGLDGGPALKLMEQEVLAFWDTTLGRALRGVPADHIWRQLPGVLDLGPVSVTATPELVVAGTQGEPWMVIHVVRTGAKAPQAHHEALLDLHALMIARATGATSVNAILAYLREPPSRVFARRLGPAELEAVAARALNTLGAMTSVRKQPLPVLQPRARCLELGCGFVELCHVPEVVPVEEHEPAEVEA
ncbi:MAG: UvrD-helicase domain-containing protein [Myxococcota bacterium]